jgi:hypothetical protein
MPLDQRSSAQSLVCQRNGAATDVELGGQGAFRRKLLRDRPEPDGATERIGKRDVERAAAPIPPLDGVCDLSRPLACPHEVKLSQLAVDRCGLGGNDGRVNQGLKPLEWLLGSWEGDARGEPGTGRQTRRYELVLRGEFIMGTNKTIWVPKPGQSESEVHEDLSLISYDRAGGRFVLHVFYVERFVAEYVCEKQTDPHEWVFTAERVQNGPPGMRARESLASREDDALDSRFELSLSGKPFALYTQETLRRRKG